MTEPTHEEIARQLARYAHVSGIVLLPAPNVDPDQLPPPAGIRIAGTLDRLEELGSTDVDS